MAEEAAESTSSPTGTVAVVVAALAALVVLVGGLALVSGGNGGPPRDRRGEAAETADAWLSAWAADDRDALRSLLVAPAPELDPVLDEFRSGVRPGQITAETGTIELVDDTATVPFETSVELPGIGTWTYDGSLRLQDVEVPVDGDERVLQEAWRVAFDPPTIHPELTAARRFELVTSFGERGQVLAADGTPLTSPGARAVVGAVGPATPEQADALGPAYSAGDPIGQSGLQAGLEERLAGTPSSEIRLLEGEETVAVAQRFEGTPGQSVTTTLEPAALGAAEAALSTGSNRGALVAIRPSTGAIVAVANRPSNGFNRAFLGRYPPGSTFKVVTTTALLASGVTPETPISCPSQVDVGGRTIRNAEGEALGDTVFAEAFYRSCNTAFVQLAERLEPSQLVDAARRLGFDREPALGTAATTSQFPEPTGVIDQVAAAIGQGRVVATPLQMASVAASVAAGGFRPPFLVAGAEPPPTFEPMPDGMAGTLQALMRRVVAEGTGTRARLPGEPVAGKTGTAEFGTERPPRTHAWFIGFRGDLAVAVVVEDSGFGGEVAAPLAADFLQRVGG